MRLPDASRLPGLQDKFSQLEKAQRRQVLTATVEGQTVFTITNGSYVVGSETLRVTVGGVPQPPDAYTETNSTTVTLSEGVPVGKKVMLEWLEGKLPVAFGHNTSHYSDGQDPIDVTKLKNYQAEVADKIGILQTNVNSNTSQVTELTKHILKWYVVTQPPYNANVGSANNKTAIQQAIDDCSASGGGIVYIPAFLNTDTISLKSNVTLMGDGASTGLKLIAHTTTHNPLIRIGDATMAVVNANVTNMFLDGNQTNQTYANEEWSAGVFIWGSNNNSVTKCVITNTQGDGITLGYDSGRIIGSNRNLIRDNEIYNTRSNRMCISITYGNENNILNNKCSGVIDLELNASTGECKNNLVQGNKGRIQTESLSSPRISDLWISLASLNIDKSRYSGNNITDNHCYMISGQYNKETIIKGNLVVGSNSTQTRLLALDAFDNSIVSDNILIANLSVATALTEILRTRAGQNLLVTDNIVENETVIFRNYIAGFGSEPSASNHVFKNNNLTGSGNYNGGSTEKVSEEAIFKLEVVSGVKTLTRLGGVPCNVTVGNSGTDLQFQVGSGSGVSYLIEIRPYCSVTSGSGATAFDSTLIYKVTNAGSTRNVAVYTSSFSSTLSFTQFNFTTGTGTFFFKITF